MSNPKSQKSPTQRSESDTKGRRTKVKIFVLLLVFVLGFIVYPNRVEALAFGGKITSSQRKICYITLGTIPVPFPLQVIRVSSEKQKIIVVYAYYQVLLQLFGVYHSLYLNYQFYRAGPSVLGTYIPVPVPWTNCPDLRPTNFILSIGTSLH